MKNASNYQNSKITTHDNYAAPVSTPKVNQPVTPSYPQ